MEHEKLLTKLAEITFIVGVVVSVIIFLAGLVIAGTPHEFNWGYFIAGIVIAALNLLSTHILSTVLNVISNISTSLKTKRYTA